jgi:hypothetical protein
MLEHWLTPTLVRPLRGVTLARVTFTINIIHTKFYWCHVSHLANGTRTRRTE